MSATRTRVPDLLLERLALGELSADEAARVRARLEEEPDGFARLEQLRRSNDEILLTYPARVVAPQLAQKAGVAREGTSKRRSFFLLALPALAAAAALGLALKTNGGASSADPETAGNQGLEETRTKGNAHLVIHRQTQGASTERLEPGARVHAHDLLQVGYWAGGQPYGVIFSIDGRGGVTLHYPEQPGLSQKLLNGGEVSLPHAYELDDAPTFERFFLVTSDAPIDLDAVLGGAREMAQNPVGATSGFLPLPADLHQWSQTLRKETR